VLVIRSVESSFAPAVAMGYNFRSHYLYPGGENGPRMHYLDVGDPQAEHVLGSVATWGALLVILLDQDDTNTS